MDTCWPFRRVFECITTNIRLWAAGVESSAGSYLWNVDSSLGADATYGLKLSLESDSTVFQYSSPFHIVAAGGSGSGSGSNSTTKSKTHIIDMGNTPATNEFS